MSHSHFPSIVSMTLCLENVRGGKLENKKNTLV